MKRLMFIVAVGAFALAACGGSDETVATVNGTEISVADVEGLAYDQEAELDPEQFAQFTGFLVQWTAIDERALDEFGIDPTEEEIEAEVAQILLDFGQGLPMEDFLAAQGIADEVITRSAKQIVIETALRDELASSAEEPTAEAAEQALAAEPLRWTEVCAAHILVATEEEATAVVARLDAGEDFVTVAAEVSTDAGSGANGGDLGCSSPDRFVPEFGEVTMTAEIGVVTAPVESEFGFHMIRVDSRTVASTEEVRAALSTDQMNELLSGWFITALTEADVVVVEAYGTWVTEPVPQVVAPS